MRPRGVWLWHASACAIFATTALFGTVEWFRGDRMPSGDFAGYAAQVQWVRDALLELGRVPRWCVECYGGSSVFTSQLKERLLFPLALVADPIVATQLGWVLLRWVGALGLYAWIVRRHRAPAVGIAAGCVYAFAALPHHQAEYLDTALSAALLPLLWMSLVEHFRRGGPGWTLALSITVALLFQNNWVHAFFAPFAAVVVLTLRPWPGRALARGWVRRSVVALAVFLTLVASNVAWLLADASNHFLFPEGIEVARSLYIEQSPFLFLDRDGWLAGWLAAHSPPDFDLAEVDAGSRYLGIVVLAVVLVGGFAARHSLPLRRSLACALLMLGFHYWLALGRDTFLGQVGGSLGWDPEWQRGLSVALRTAAAGCAVAAAVVWRSVPVARRAPLSSGALRGIALVLACL